MKAMAVEIGLLVYFKNDKPLFFKRKIGLTHQSGKRILITISCAIRRIFGLFIYLIYIK